MLFKQISKIHTLHKLPLLNLYYTLIFPYLLYCNIVWGCNYKSSLNHLYILQKRIVRIICGLRWCASTKLSFYELHLLTLENINKCQILLFMFSFHNNLLLRSLHTNVASCLKEIWIYTLTLPNPLLTIEAIMLA